MCAMLTCSAALRVAWLAALAESAGYMINHRSVRIIIICHQMYRLTGSRNAVSARFISAAIFNLKASGRAVDSAVSRQTPAGLPENGAEVNAST